PVRSEASFTKSATASHTPRNGGGGSTYATGRARWTPRRLTDSVRVRRRGRITHLGEMEGDAMRDSSRWSRGRAGLLLACGALIVLSPPAHTQSAMPVDQKQPWFNACMDAITAKVRAKQVRAQKVEWLVDTVTQRQRSSTETAVNGKGQFLGEK